MKTRPLVLALAAALMILTAACGVDATDQAGAPAATTKPSGDGDTTATTAASDDGSDTTAPADDETTEPSDDETTTQPVDDGGDSGDVDQKLLDQFLALGMSQEQAECAAGAISKLGISADDFENGVPDPTAIDPEKLNAYIDEYTACFGIDTGN